MNESTRKYYLGGYYLIKLKPINFGPDKGSLIYTCSECINDHLLDVWSYKWNRVKDKSLVEAKKKFKIPESQVGEIKDWVDKKRTEKKIGWVNVFFDLETVLEYKSKFFSHLSDVKLFALYFEENDRIDFLKEFKPPPENTADIGLRLTLLKELEEQENEEFLGFDYIAIEIDGGFHTFHCNINGKELFDKFGIATNQYGLLDNKTNAKNVLEFLNDEENGCEPLPWFIVKTKLVMNE